MNLSHAWESPFLGDRRWSFDRLRYEHYFWGGGGSGAIHKNRNVEIDTMEIPLFLEILLLQSGHKLRQKSAK